MRAKSYFGKRCDNLPPLLNAKVHSPRTRTFITRIARHAAPGFSRRGDGSGYSNATRIACWALFRLRCSGPVNDEYLCRPFSGSM